MYVRHSHDLHNAHLSDLHTVCVAFHQHRVGVVLVRQDIPEMHNNILKIAEYT